MAEIVFITGGSRGIGAALVRSFTQAGYRVAFTYVSSVLAAQALAKETGAMAIRADSASPDEIVQATAFVKERLGDIDILINNAAVSLVKLYHDVTEEEWETIRNINLEGPMRYIRSVLPDMISRKKGKIINISSMWGQVGASCEVHYSVTKAALIGLTKALSKEVGPSGITVNAISPGIIDTEMNAAFTEQEKTALAEETPLGRLGTTEDVALCALFLAGKGGDFITGQILAPNGGFVI